MSDRPFVVVIDDDPSVCRALRRLLRISQMDAVIYSSAEGFLASRRERAPDCLVLDVRMPGTTGPDLRDQLVSNGHRTPIVFITAHAEDVARQRSPAGGFAEILHKPFDDKALLEAIGRAIRKGREPN